MDPPATALRPMQNQSEQPCPYGDAVRRMGGVSCSDLPGARKFIGNAKDPNGDLKIGAYAWGSSGPQLRGDCGQALSGQQPLALAQETLEAGVRQRPAEQVALQLVAMVGAQELQVLLDFHAFGHYATL